MGMQFFSADDGARLAFLDAGGAGVPVMALAGLTRDHKDFDYVARHLSDCRLIRLDARGRGASDRTGPATYNLGRESADVLALMDHLGLDRAAILGSSRGGLIGLILGATRPERITGLCLNDVGPAVERAGLERIGEYIGQTPSVTTLTEAADRMPRAMPGFANIPASRWAEEAVRHFRQAEDHLDLPYDPRLRESFDAAMAGPPGDLWPQFDACAGIPMALIHGAGSDVLSAGTVAEMIRRRPDMICAEIPDRGHIPFLDEPRALAAITAWLGLVRDASSRAAAMASGDAVAPQRG